MDNPTILFRDPDKLMSDLSACTRFKIPDEVAQLAVLKVATILQGDNVALDADGNPRPARPREVLAAARVLAGMERINQMEQDRYANLMGIAAQIQASVESELRTARLREKEESGHDFVLRVAAETKQALDAIGALEGSAGLAPDQPVRDGPAGHAGPNGNGNGSEA